jgi:hypothetical protein
MLLAHPLRLIFIGFVLVSFGLVVPLLMIFKFIPNGYLLSFVSYGASFLGLILGIIGSAMYVREKHDSFEDREMDKWWNEKDEGED